MADHETLEESLDFAFISKDGKFVGNRDAVLTYNQAQTARSTESLPWVYSAEYGLKTKEGNYLLEREQFHRLYRAFASLDEAAQRAFLTRGEGE